MTKEKYQNGDIYWNTYSGKFKMFDKDGNEIPCEYLEQLAKRLEQERDELKQENERIYNDGQTEITRLCNENNKLKSALEEIRRIIALAYKTEDYLLGQDYTDLVDRINEVLNVKY
jgi:hypothetical protein